MTTSKKTKLGRGGGHPGTPPLGETLHIITNTNLAAAGLVPHVCGQ